MTAPRPLPCSSTPATPGLRWAAFVFGLVLAGSGPALAQYKVVGPDGTVTYTDRPPPAGTGRATPTATGTAGSTETGTSPTAGLPYGLAQVASRFPATLYTGPGCEVCDTARSFLRQRGIPYAEKLVGPNDGEALQRLTGGRSIPVLTLGGQVLRGWSADTWASYLDAAGYPKQSALPPNYRAPAPTPMTPPRPSGTEAAAPSAAPPPPPPAPPPAPGGIRF